MNDELYTYEDYTKDFELDYLGFDKAPDESVPDSSPEKITEKKPEHEADDLNKNNHTPHLRFQK